MAARALTVFGPDLHARPTDVIPIVSQRRLPQETFADVDSHSRSYHRDWID